MKDGIATGLTRFYFEHLRSATTISSLRSFINAAVDAGYGDGITAIIMIPHEFSNTSYVTHKVPRIGSLDGYVPRNLKLLTYPYCFIEEQNCEGATAILPQEYFVSQQETPGMVDFLIELTQSASPICGCTPLNYKNSVINRAEAMYINNFVQCSWNIDLFKAYLAQSLTAKVGNQVTDAVAPAVNDTSHVWNNFLKPLITGDDSSVKSYEENRVMSQNAFSELTADTVRSNAFPAMALAASASPIIGSATGINSFGMSHAGYLAGNIYDTMKELYAKAVAPPHNTGCNTPDFFTGKDEKGFWFFHRTIRREFAERIDKYFDMFGYAIHTVAVPNLHARARYTYIKTIGAQVDGNIPSEAVSLIQNVLNNGITFWADTTNFGDYSLANPII